MKKTTDTNTAGTPGRPPLYDEPVRPRTITVTDWHWKRAKEIGDGEGASSGIRRALEAYQEE